MFQIAFCLLFVASDDYAAEVLFANPAEEHYVGRATALALDDRPGLRAALQKIAVDRGYMLPYQATLFDDGYGAAVRALELLRQARQREIWDQFPNYRIRR